MTVRVRWGEADALGIAFYPNFYAWFDQAAHELFRGPDLSMASLLEDGGYSVPIVECGAKFLGPAFYDDELVVTSTVTDLRSRSFRVDHAVARAAETLATGFEVRVIARRDPNDGRRLEVVRIPEHVRAWLASE